MQSSLADESFAKGGHKTCALVNNNLCRKVFSSLELPTKFDESLKDTSVSFFIPDF